MRHLFNTIGRRWAALAVAFAAVLSITVVAAPSADASCTSPCVYRVPASGSINLSSYPEPTATWVGQQFISGATQHNVNSIYIGDRVGGHSGTEYYLQSGTIHAQYWNGTSYVTYWTWTFGDCGYRCYGWGTTAGSSWRPGAIYIYFDLTLGSGLGHTYGRYKL